MSMSTFQKLTLVSCLVLCVSLLLPKMLLSGGKKDATQGDGPPGHFPPMLHRKPAPEAARGTRGHFSRTHNPEAIARAKGSMAAGGKSNLAGQIIPVYGFGILLYILYIIFKITSRGKATQPHESRFPTLRSENMKRKITDFELAQLQERLKETEEVMENMVSRAHAQHCSPKRAAPVTMAQEEALLLQLKEITRVMQEGQLVEGITPQKGPIYEPDWADESNGMDYGEETNWESQQTHVTEGQHRNRHEDGDDFADDSMSTKKDDIAGQRDEDFTDQKMMDLDVLSAFGAVTENQTSQKLHYDHPWNTSPSHDSLIRRKNMNA